MRIPVVYTPTEVKEWHVEEEYEKGKHRLARPCGFAANFSWAIWKMRLKITWRVFTGKYDALNWQGTGKLPDSKTNYRDVTDPEFGKVGDSDNVSFVLKVKMYKRWIPHFRGMLEYMQRLGAIGSSREVGFMSDGDGDFRPVFDWPEDLAPAAEAIKDENGNRYYDAG